MERGLFAAAPMGRVGRRGGRRKKRRSLLLVFIVFLEILGEKKKAGFGNFGRNLVFVGGTDGWETL